MIIDNWPSFCRRGLTPTLVFAAALFLLPVGAQERHPSGRPERTLPRLPAGFHEVVGTDPDLPFDDLAPLADIIGDASLVGLGESIHTSGGFYEAKHRLLRYLVQELGFRAFGIESPWQNAEWARTYVATGEGTATEAIAGIFGVWQSEAVLAMIEWLREWNVEHPDDPVHFFGFDNQQPDQDGAALRAFLEQVGGDPALIDGLYDCDGFSGWIVSSGTNPGNQVCLGVFDGIEDFFETENDAIVAATSEVELEWAWIHLIGLRAWECDAYGRYWDDPINHRDWGMAECLPRLQRLICPDLKTVIWAHNWHLDRNTPLLNQASSMGTYLAARLGADYAPIALVAYKTRIHWYYWIPEPLEFVATTAVELRLHAYQRTALLIENDALCPPDQDCIWTEPAPEPYYTLELPFAPQEEFRAILFLDESPEMIPVYPWLPGSGFAGGSKGGP